MAGRPLGLRSLVRALSRYSRAQLKKLIASVPTEDNRVAKLKAKRDKHARAIAKLDRQIAKLSGGNGAVSAPKKRRRGKLSAATRRKMSEAAKRRHAGGAKSDAPAAAGERTRKPFSAETRAKMAAAQKARWAKVKGAAQPT